MDIFTKTFIFYLTIKTTGIWMIRYEKYTDIMKIGS